MANSLAEAGGASKEFATPQSEASAKMATPQSGMSTDSFPSFRGAAGKAKDEAFDKLFGGGGVGAAAKGQSKPFTSPSIFESSRYGHFQVLK